MKSLKHLNKYLWKYKNRLFLGIIFVAVSNVFGIYPAQIIRDAFDEVAKSLSATPHLKETTSSGIFSSFVENFSLQELLLFFAALVLLMALLKGIFTFFTRQTIIIMSRLIEYDLKNEIYQHYQELSMSFYKSNNTGDIMNRISEDVSRVRMYLGPGIMYSINLITLFVLVITVMLSINVKLTLFSLAPLPVLSVLIYVVSNKINSKSERVQRQLSFLTTMSQETFSGIRIIKSFVKEKYMSDTFDAESEKYKNTNLDLVRLEAFFFPIMMLLIGLSTILTIYIGGLEVIKGNITTGNIAEFVIYVNMLTWPVTAVGWVTSLTQRAAASQTRINEFLQTVPEIRNNNKQKSIINGEIVFENVRFVYPESGTEALSDINFRVKSGETLAIIGKTGSGKSTIADLICRLFDPTEGNIFIDGKDLRDVNLNQLRSNIGYVPQEVFLFSDSISNNIAFGYSQEQPDMEKIQKASGDAAILSNIIEFPNQFETQLGERGITLSGGQKQRVSIARAIIKEPKILIFDDCLSAVDTETEEEILNNLAGIMANSTTLIISHRISSVKQANKILVLDKGRIVEEGTHQELFDLKGLYYQTYQKQLLESQKNIASTS